MNEESDVTNVTKGNGYSLVKTIGLDHGPPSAIDTQKAVVAVFQRFTAWSSWDPFAPPALKGLRTVNAHGDFGNNGK